MFSSIVCITRRHGGCIGKSRVPRCDLAERVPGVEVRAGQVANRRAAAVVAAFSPGASRSNPRAEEERRVCCKQSVKVTEQLNVRRARALERCCIQGTARVEHARKILRKWRGQLREDLPPRIDEVVDEGLSACSAPERRSGSNEGAPSSPDSADACPRRGAVGRPVSCVGSGKQGDACSVTQRSIECVGPSGKGAPRRRDVWVRRRKAVAPLSTGNEPGSQVGQRRGPKRGLQDDLIVLRGQRENGLNGT